MLEHALSTQSPVLGAALALSCAYTFRRYHGRYIDTMSRREITHFRFKSNICQSCWTHRVFKEDIAVRNVLHVAHPPDPTAHRPQWGRDTLTSSKLTAVAPFPGLASHPTRTSCDRQDRLSVLQSMG